MGHIEMYHCILGISKAYAKDLSIFQPRIDYRTSRLSASYFTLSTESSRVDSIVVYLAERQKNWVDYLLSNRSRSGIRKTVGSGWMTSTNVDRVTLN